MVDGNAEQVRAIVEQVVSVMEARVGRERAQLTMIEKVVGACVIALLAWVGATVQATDKRVAVIEARLSTATEGRYSAAEASRDKEILLGRIELLSQRVSTLEKKH